MRIALRLAVLASCVTAAPLAAQSTAYYLLDGDSERGFIVQNGAVQSTFSIPKSPSPANSNSQYALRFQGSNFLVARRQGQQAIEYNSAGVATGVVYNYTQNFDQLLDGTTNGQFTYSARCCGGGGIIRGDINFGGLSQLGNFTTDLSGIAYAASSNTLFATDFGSSLYEFSLSGALLNTYNLNIAGSLGALAFEASTNTLWGAVNGTNNIRQFSLTGAQLASISVTGGLAGNIWGGEMRNATVVPEPSTYALLATGLAALVGVARRRRSA